MRNILTTLTLAISVLIIVGCENNPGSERIEKNGNVLEYVVIKKKYSENNVTKDIVFGTGNWHKTKRYILGTDGELYEDRLSMEDWITSEVGDTLWITDKKNFLTYTMRLNKSNLTTKNKPIIIEFN